MIANWTDAYARKENKNRKDRSELDSKNLIKPQAIARVIKLMLNSHKITGRKKYIQRADHFARLGIALFLGDGLPLPKATNQHDHYESIKT